MKCTCCDKEYKRGRGYKGEHYANLHFCSEECYNKYCSSRNEENQSRKLLTDFIQDWTQDMVNWQLIMKQVKEVQNEYNLKYRDIYQILKYCRYYEELDWNLEYGLRQFINPKYIDATLTFATALNANKKVVLDEPTYLLVKKNKSNRRKVETF